VTERSFVWWKWALVALIGLLLWQIIKNSQFIAVIGLSSLGMLPRLTAWIPAAAAIIALAITLIGFGLLYRWPGGGLRTLGLRFEDARRDVLIGLAVALLHAALALFVILPLMGESGTRILGSVSALFESPERLIASAILVVLYGGVVEEIFFRGHVITSISRTLGGRQWAVAVAAFVSIALFAVGHAYQGTAGMVYSLAAAALWTALFLVTGRLVASMVAHAGYDLLMLIGIYLLHAEAVGAA
jgi:uncharacterized protein